MKENIVLALTLVVACALGMMYVKHWINLFDLWAGIFLTYYLYEYKLNRDKLI